MKLSVFFRSLFPFVLTAAVFCPTGFSQAAPAETKSADANAAKKGQFKYSDADKQLAEKLKKEFKAQYDAFITGITARAEKSAAEKLRFTKKSTTALNSAFSKHAKTQAIGLVLPEFAKAGGVNLEPTLLAIIEKNKNPDIYSAAMYALAMHLHHSKRDPKRVVRLLELAKKDLANVPYNGRTLGEAAAQSLYIVNTLSVGKPAPQFEGTDADGVKLQLSEYHGKVIVIRFWGDWCPFCRQMFQQERELIRKHRDQQFVLLGVNSDSRKRLKESQKKNNLVWRTFWDGGNTSGPIANKYQVRQWPTIYVVDHRGIIRFVAEGVKDGRCIWLDDNLNKLIKEADDAKKAEVATKKESH